MLAAGSIAVVALGARSLGLFDRDVEIATAVGELRKAPLADGSTIAVNTASRVAISLRGTARDIDLKQGEAWFQVAHDKARPFTVSAGAVRVRAVGTAFAVRRRARGVEVLVNEGAVEAWVVGGGAPVRIAAGEKGFLAESSPHAEVVAAPTEIDRALAWRTGELALNGESLAYAVGELNRYNVRQIRVDDPALGRETLVGYFRTDQPENFSRAVARLIGARVETDGDEIRIAR